MTRIKKMTLGLSATALALGAGLGLAGMASATTPAPSPSAGASAESGTAAPEGGMGMHGGRGMHGGGMHGAEQASALAGKLGVDKADVTEALQAFHEANRPFSPPAEGRPDRATREANLAKSLAEALGIEEAKVTAALGELRNEAQAERAAALKDRLDQAVTDGKLTQAEADAVAKAVEAGVIGGGGH
ncbi:hypothetical protein ACFWIX_07015 [Pseudarthrobacter sp. NPDC058362]|uniref:hypothetical protein n=1 Tax=Pseudarthrobacter sp. NPDC058362 TaxID=3346458 RepID=UPI00366A4B19